MPECKDDLPLLSGDQIFEVLEHIYNQVLVLDGEKRIIYVNGGFARNYGVLPKDVIGRSYEEFLGQLWFDSALLDVYEKKRQMSYERTTYLGSTDRSIATPVLDQEGGIELVVCITEEKFENFDIQCGAVLETPEERQEPADTPDRLCAFSSPRMQRLMEMVQQYAQSDTAVLIEGDSGTGKSMLARYIHDSSPRKDGPFLALNCAAIADGLLESELFGYAPCAFTGASPKGKRGLVEMADRGSLFLDEIGEMPLLLQAKLLDFVETGSFIPVGGKEVRRVDIRVLAATNRDLLDMVACGSFREDLYWRINVLSFQMPRLRDRREDIPLLANWFLWQQGNPQMSIGQEAMNALMAYDWPGNIRQLRNVIERTAIFAEEDVLKREDLPEEITGKTGQGPTPSTYDRFVAECERSIVTKSFQKFHSSRGVAEELGISQSKANRLLQKYVGQDRRYKAED